MNKTFDTETSSATATEAPSTSEWGFHLKPAQKFKFHSLFFAFYILGSRQALAALQENNFNVNFGAVLGCLILVLTRLWIISGSQLWDLGCPGLAPGFGIPAGSPGRGGM